MNYGYTRKYIGSFDDAVTKTRNALAREGFGILTEIDARAVLKKKLDVTIENYIIFGACNPPFAYQALQIETEIGLLLPCNVIVYEKEGSIFVSTIKPSVAMGMVENVGMKDIAAQIEEKLTRAVDSLV